MTKVGLWFVIVALVTAVAATNTGNNALYLVLAVMLATLVVSGVASRRNVRALHIELQPPAEVFSKQPFHLDFTLTNRSRFIARWFLLLTVGRGAPRLIPHLARSAASRGQVEMILRRRGKRTLSWVHVTSLFPFGLFRKGERYKVGLEMLVFPEIYPEASARVEPPEAQGESGSRRAGWGHDLHGLRGFRQGDDPRSIHWKQSARTGDLVYMEREAEKSRRLSILFDNGLAGSATETVLERFEHLVSEAATSALDYLGRGYEVELVSRDGRVAFAGGPRQRLAILEALAVIEPFATARSIPLKAHDLRSQDPNAVTIRLALERREMKAS